MQLRHWRHAVTPLASCSYAICAAQLRHLRHTDTPLEKITIKQLFSVSYAEFSEENENEPCQIVSLGKKKL